MQKKDAGQEKLDHGASSTAAAPAIGLFAGDQFSGVHTENAELSPTTEAMLYWAEIYKIMNLRLFGDKLPNCMITLERRGRAFGYFRPNSFKNRHGEIAHQIAMNPECFEPYGDLEAFQTLAHEMCHLWREVLGPRNKNGCTGTRGYHCRVWGGKLQDIGLMPSHTGKPGGRKTGYQMMDYVIEGGKFDLLTRELLENGMHVEWRDALQRYVKSDAAEPGFLSEVGVGVSASSNSSTGQGGQKPKRQSRAKFVCPSCDLKVYTRPAANLMCCDCGMRVKRDFGGAA